MTAARVVGTLWRVARKFRQLAFENLHSKPGISSSAAFLRRLAASASGRFIAIQLLAYRLKLLLQEHVALLFRDLLPGAVVDALCYVKHLFAACHIGKQTIGALLDARVASISVLG